MENPSKNTVAQLRSRSWEMELLLSGFVLVLLLPVPGYLEQQGSIWLTNLNIGIIQQLFTIIFVIGLFSSRILIANLIIYLFFRGFWVGIVGLTSAFPEGIRWSQLPYQDKYHQYLRRKTWSTDYYVELINRIGSSVFSFSFLLVFLVVAFFSFLIIPMLVAVTFNRYFADYPDAHWVSRVLGLVLPLFLITYICLGFIFLLDFLTFGLIKRLDWKPLQRLYFPLYRFFRWITLARLYTPIYYTFVSNVPKKITALLLIAYLGIFLFFTNYRYSEEIFYPTERTSAQLLNQYYEDQYDETRSTPHPLIPSEYITRAYLRLFLPYLVSDNDSLQHLCPEVDLLQQPGFIKDFNVRIGTVTSTDTTQTTAPQQPEENVQAALHCLASMYQISINDSLCHPPVFYFYRNDRNGQPGLVTYLALTSLPDGPHQLTIRKRDYTSANPEAYQTHFIPFIKE